MMAEPLVVLLQLHQQAIESERRAMIEAVDAWNKALARATAIRRAIARETADAVAQEGRDDLVEAFAFWLTHAQAELTVAEAAETDAEAVTSRQRASLAAARASARAIEIGLERQAAARQTAGQRQLQAELDEAGLRSHAERRRSENG